MRTLLEVTSERLRTLHYSPNTEQIYTHWIRRFIRFHKGTHPRQMGHAEVREFLSDLAVRGQVSASTQNQALSAVLFLYRHVLEIKLPWIQDVVRAKRPVRVPTVLSRAEVQDLLAVMEGRSALIARLLYGTGMRLRECLRLRIQDVDFGRNEITVRGGKGGKDRRTVLPSSITVELKSEIERATQLHDVV